MLKHLLIMNRFDPKKGQSDRDDSSSRKNENAGSPFMKDKRPRISKPTERNESRGGDRRHSYNPNFTSDNRLKDGSTTRRYNDQDKPYRRQEGEDRPYRQGGGKPYQGSGSGRPYEKSGDRPYRKPEGDNKPYRQGSGEGKPYREGGYRQGGEDRPYRQGGGKPYHQGAGSSRPYEKSDRPYRKPEGDSRPYRQGGGDDKPYREGGYRQGGEGRPYRRQDGENKPYRQGGEKPYRQGSGEGKPWNKNSAGKGKGGYNKPKQYNEENYPRFAAQKTTGEMRLNKFIANSGVCSRREADELIESGAITVNGKVVTELGSKIMPGDEVRFNGEIMRGEPRVYILMNKPKGFVTTIDDPHADRTVIDLVKNICKERVYPVGRLDKNSLGVLILTNDGDLTKKLTHPSYNKKKIYQVSLDKPLTRGDMETLAEGVELEDGIMAADEISYIGENKKEVGIEIHSGRNRIVRRMFEALGYNVLKLDRVYFAGLTKKHLKRGGWRFLTPAEVGRLKAGDYE